MLKRTFALTLVLASLVAFGQNALKYSITVTNEAEGSTNVYTVPHNAGILVHTGDHVDRGQELTSGALNPHDVLSIRGIDDLNYPADEYHDAPRTYSGVRNYLVQEVQKVQEEED